MACRRRSAARSFPKIAAMMDNSEADVLAYMSFPKAHRMQIHSTNPLERLNAEIKRRTDVVGIFPNEAAITRLVGALLLEQSDEWSCSVVTCSLKDCRPSATIKPRGCPPWSTEHRSRPNQNHDSYTTSWDTTAGASRSAVGDCEEPEFNRRHAAESPACPPSDFATARPRGMIAIDVLSAETGVNERARRATLGPRSRSRSRCGCRRR